MKKETKQCFQCGESDRNNNVKLYGYVICKTCKPKLRLLEDIKIKRHVSSFGKPKAKSSNNVSYEEEINYRLNYLEKDYISKRIKLLHIQERLKQIK